MIAPLLLAIHLLCAVLWVGGMAFAIMVLAPSLAVLQPPERLATLTEIFRRFFRLVWHVMPILLLSGYAMLFGIYGGFAHAAWPIHVMHLTGLIMAALFAYIYFAPWRAMQHAPTAETATRIRRLISINLGLGLLTVAIAAWAGI